MKDKSSFIGKAWKKSNYEVIMFCVLFFSVLFNLDYDGILPWDIYSYVIDYSHGIANKFLAGEIVSWFTDYDTVKTVFIIATSQATALCVLLACFGGRIIRRLSEDTKNTVFILFLILFLMPPGIGGLIRFIGTPDLFMALAMMLCVLLSQNTLTFFLVPIISAVSVGFHQNFVVLFFPAVFVAMYRYSCENKYNRLKMVATVFSAVMTMAAFVFITFFANDYLDFADVNEFIEYLNSKSDVDYSDSVYLLSQYFCEVDEYLGPALQEVTGISSHAIMVIMCLPLLGCISAVFIYSMKLADTGKKKFLYFLCSVSWVPNLAMIFVMTDIFRVTASLWLTQFVIFAIFIGVGDKEVLQSIEKLKGFLLSNKLAVTAYFLLVFSFRYYAF